VSRVSNQILLRLVSILALSLTIFGLTSAMTLATADANSTIPACQSSQLQMTVDQGGGAYSAAGNQGIAVIYRNSGDAVCSLEGYPMIRFTPSSFRGRSVTFTHGGGGIFASASPRRVELKPDAATSFGIDYGDAYNQSPAYNHATCITQTVAAWPESTGPTYPVGFVAPLKINFCFADFKFSVTPLESGAVPALSSAAVSTPAPLQAQEIDVAGPTGLIVGNFHGIYKTVDAGQKWTNITPPEIASQPVLLSHVDKIVSLGVTRIWIELEGDARTDFTAYSSNGGMTWRSLKRTAVATYPIQKWRTTGLDPHASVPKGLRILDWYLVTRSLGWARAAGPENGITTPIYLLRSTNDGRTWTRVST
jgi:hypothetical protein